eukprot:406985-Pyramimonas_sp.AAC.1
MGPGVPDGQRKHIGRPPRKVHQEGQAVLRRRSHLLDPRLAPISRSGSTKLVVFADIRPNYEGPIVFEMGHEVRSNGRRKELQPPLSLKKEP